MAVERIIGVDFGTSTSVIRIKRYENGEPVGDRLMTMSVEFNMGNTMVPTLLQKLPSGASAYFGYEAEIPHRGTELFSNFKTQLEAEDDKARSEARKLTEDYFAYLAKAYKAQSDGGHLGDNADAQKTIISYPVKWSGETRKFMLETAKKAGFQNVEGMDEAQAAICAVTVQNTELLMKKGYFRAGVPVNILLVDMGAGTTDLVLCRHIPGNEPKTETLCTWPKKGSALFGGREVDELLKRYILSNIPEEAVNAISKKLDSEKYKAWKENTVSPSLLKNETVDYFSELDNLLDFLDLEAEFSLDRGSFETLAKDYLSQFPQLVNDCLDEAGMDGGEIDLVILTGGHSQWYFVREILSGRMNQFGKVDLWKIAANHGRIITITRPQETVALGMVYSPMGGMLAQKVQELGEDVIVKENGFLFQREGDNYVLKKYDGNAVDIVIPGEVRGRKVIKIGDHAFKGIASLKNVTISEGVTEIGDHAFKGITSLKNVTISEGVTEIGDHAFEGCSSLENVTIPEGATRIGSSVFKYCDRLKNVTILEGVTEIGDHAFYWCSSLKNVTIPEGVTKIGDYAFWGCDALKNIVIPEGVTKIGDYAIAVCYSLENVTLPETVTEIGVQVFSGCKSLKHVTMHKKIKKIGEMAFWACENLEWIDFGIGHPGNKKVYFPPELQLIEQSAFGCRYTGCNRTRCYLKEVVLSRHTKVEDSYDYELQPGMKGFLLGKYMTVKTFDPQDVKVSYYED